MYSVRASLTVSRLVRFSHLQRFPEEAIVDREVGRHVLSYTESYANSIGMVSGQ